MKRFMVDLKTLGVNPGAVILSIGAVRFDSENPGDWFYSRVDLRDSLLWNFVIEPDTLMWWFRHGEASLEHASLGGEPVINVLFSFKKFIGEGKLEIWGNGATFDNDILRGAFVKAGRGIDLWERREDRCYRTLVQTAGAGIPVDYDAVLPLVKPPEYWGTIPRHHALRDAACQAAHAVKCFERVGCLL